MSIPPPQLGITARLDGLLWYWNLHEVIPALCAVEEVHHGVSHHLEICKCHLIACLRSKKVEHVPEAACVAPLARPSASALVPTFAKPRPVFVA